MKITAIIVSLRMKIASIIVGSRKKFMRINIRRFLGTIKWREQGLRGCFELPLGYAGAQWSAWFTCRLFQVYVYASYSCLASFSTGQRAGNKKHVRPYTEHRAAMAVRVSNAHALINTLILFGTHNTKSCTVCWKTQDGTYAEHALSAFTIQWQYSP